MINLVYSLSISIRHGLVQFRGLYSSWTKQAIERGYQITLINELKIIITTKLVWLFNNKVIYIILKREAIQIWESFLVFIWSKTAMKVKKLDRIQNVTEGTVSLSTNSCPNPEFMTQQSTIPKRLVFSLQSKTKPPYRKRTGGFYVAQGFNKKHFVFMLQNLFVITALGASLTEIFIASSMPVFCHWCVSNIINLDRRKIL